MLGLSQSFAVSPKTGGTLNVGLHIPFATLDWQATVQHPAPQVQNNVWEGLTAYGKDFTAAPELAESWSSSDDGIKLPVPCKPLNNTASRAKLIPL